MTFKRKLIKLLDRRPLRNILAIAATQYSRRKLGVDVNVAYQNGWYHTVDGVTIPDREQFDIFEPHVLRWRSEVRSYFADAEEMWFVKYSPSPGDIIIDIGAGKGEDVLAFSRAVGPSGRVIAVEAHPGTFRQLERLCYLNNLENVTTLNLAVMDHPCTVTIESTDDWQSNTVSENASAQGDSVQAITIDGLCEKIGLTHIDFLKMNIEGAEKFAIKGMSKSIHFMDCVCICCHDFRSERGHGEFYRTKQQTLQFLFNTGFEIFSRPDAPYDYVRDHIFGLRTE